MNKPLHSRRSDPLKKRGIGTTFNEIMQRDAKERGLTPLKLEPDLLLKRIRQGGFSAKFLGQAFLSVCDISDFNESLGKLVLLDAEEFRLFHEILHIRYINGWSEDENQKIANEIETILSPFVLKKRNDNE